MREQVNNKVVIDVITGEISVPRVMLNYREDWESSDEVILKFVFKYLQGPQNLSYKAAH